MADIMMWHWFIPLALILAALGGFYMGIRKAWALQARAKTPISSRPVYHGLLFAAYSTLPSLVIVLLLAVVFPLWAQHEIFALLPPELITSGRGDQSFLFSQLMEYSALPAGDQATIPAELQPAVARMVCYQTVMRWGVPMGIAALSMLGIFIANRKERADYPARQKVERVAISILFMCSLVSVVITAAIVMSVLVESLRFFDQIPVMNFLFGTTWSPQTATGERMADNFGAVPLFAGTFLIMIIAMIVAVPLGLFSAIYMAEYASQTTRTYVKPMLEILAGIPTVVYGYFAILILSPLLRSAGATLGLEVASESALVAGLVMGVMIIPFISSLSDDVITAIPRALREASLGLGATRSETITKVVLPAALPGIMGAVLLAISRAIGETMIVVMAAGLAANLTANPLESVTTVTVQIVAMLVGDQQFDSPRTLVAFALGLALFVVTLVLNIVALHIVKTYREKYE